MKFRCVLYSDVPWDWTIESKPYVAQVPIGSCMFDSVEEAFAFGARHNHRFEVIDMDGNRWGCRLTGKEIDISQAEFYIMEKQE